MRLFHRTPHAEAILRDGFRDRRGSLDLTGVWFSDVPLDINAGAKGPTVLVVEIPEEDLVDFEVREEGKPYREWCVPAALANRFAARVADDDLAGVWSEHELRRRAAALRETGNPLARAKADELEARLPFLLEHDLLGRRSGDEEDDGC